MAFVSIVTEDESFELEIGESCFEVRRISSDFYNNLLKKYKKTVYENHQKTEKIDSEKLGEDLLDYMIIGWKKVIHPVTCEEVPCIKENKLKLPTPVRNRIANVCLDSEITEKKIV